jgi:hypothetical protein
VAAGQREAQGPERLILIEPARPDTPTKPDVHSLGSTRKCRAWGRCGRDPPAFGGKPKSLNGGGMQSRACGRPDR